ncbi:MAG: 16S rRNA (cytosine(967)-C(5))-methyltransferase RsmB [Terrisporobacter sp.]|uniref:16S rRNA (cytosine(967)-C(5))-methyltransferase RsmB n=1 Tax=Terrisporobacter sp. TaxID=1965305 RepID=UPI002FC5BFE0
MNAREIAYKVLLDIEKNDNYSNMAINKHFKDVKLSNQDRGLATEIIYGVVENKYYIDYIIDKLSKVKSDKMEIYVKTLLRMGIYQIMFLNSISDYAAVNETVNLAKKNNAKVSGFINGILRNVIRNKETIGNITVKDDIDYLSIKYSYDKWIIRNWMIHFGDEFTRELLEANSEKPSIYVRTNTLKITRDELIERLQEQGVKASKVSQVEEAIKVENLKNIENNSLYKDGLFTVQDISSMLVGKVMSPKENSLVLDVCSAPGGKTTHIATLMKNTGKVVARDIYDHKLKLINASCKRLDLNNVDVESFDALKLDKESVAKFDYVLADVPCSGLGIIKRKPEIKYKEKEDFRDLPPIQKRILENAAKCVKRGGTLIYSTCTIQDTENIEVINEFLQKHRNFELAPINEVNIDLDNQEKGYMKIYPNVHGIDGFFIAKLIRVR